MIAQALTKLDVEERPRRVEDPRFLTGTAKFLDDLNFPGQAYMGLVLSPYAHARIRSVDLSKARDSPLFVDALTGEDLLRAGVRPVSQNPWPQQRRSKRYHLAVGETRFVGEAVAAVLARDRYSVEDLLEMVEVDYEPLPPVTTIEGSKRGEQLVYGDWKDNVSQTDEQTRGDPDRAIAAAHRVVRRRVGISRQAGAPMEPHAVVVSYDRAVDRFEVLATLQSVHGLQRALAGELGLPQSKFHVRVVDVGGGFGSKGGPSYPWPLLACVFAQRTGLTVKWTATRMEEFLEGAAGRDEYCDVTLACDKDGRIVALKGRIECDVGVGGTQSHMASLSMETMTGPYDIPNLDLAVTTYVTNKMPIGPVRGAGAPEGCYFIERVVEVMARELGIDPLEFRRRNVVGTERTDGVDYQALMDALVRPGGYADILRWRDGVNAAFRRSPRSSPLVAGVGVSLRGSSEEEEDSRGSEDWSAGSEGSAKWEGGSEGGGASQWQSAGEGGESAWDEGGLSFTSEWGRVVLHASGDVTVFTGSSPHGQGHETAFAQLASEELGVPLGRIRVVWGDTDLVPFGIGTFGSRSAATGGSAVVDASRKVRAQLLERASRLLGADPKSLALVGGVVARRSNPDLALATIPDVMAGAGGQDISAESKFDLGSMTYSSGVHVCALLLDAGTGRVSRIARYVVVEDCGRMINETIVEGQIRGGVVHGVGGSLLEALKYDEDGNLLTTGFGDYAIPSSVDAPEVEVSHRVTPSTVSLNGVKGVGESGTIGSYAAVMNALNDALGQLRSGAHVDTAPATPDLVLATVRGERRA